MPKRKPRKAGHPYDVWLRTYQNGPGWPEHAHVVGVLWLDAAYRPPEDGDEESEPLMAFTVGLVRDATPERVILAHEMFADADVRGKTGIPREQIKAMVTFVKVRPFVEAGVSSKA